MVDLIDIIAVACEKVELVDGATPRFVACRDEDQARSEFEELVRQAERMEGLARRPVEHREPEWERDAYQVGRYGFTLVCYERRWSIEVAVGLTPGGIRRFYWGEIDGAES